LTYEEDWIPGPSEYIVSKTGDENFGELSALTAKITPDGDIVWVKPEIMDRCYVRNPKGGIFMGSMFMGTMDADPGPGVTQLSAIGEDEYIAQFDSNGEFVNAWAMGVSGQQMGSPVIAADINGCAYVATGVDSPALIKICP
jgi:hypothetical protein